MQDEAFQSIDQTTQQLLHHQQLETKLKEMANRCLLLSESLQIEKEHTRSIEGVSNLFDEKLTQMSQLIIDFLALQNYIMKQVDLIEQLNTGLKSLKDNLALEGKTLTQAAKDIKKNNTLLFEDIRKLVKDESKTQKLNWQQIVNEKDAQIISLKVALEKTTQSRDEDKKMFDKILKKMTVIQSSIEGFSSKNQSQSKNDYTILQKKCKEQQREIQRLSEQLESYKNVGANIGFFNKFQKPKQIKVQSLKVQNSRLSNLKTSDPPSFNWKTFNSEKYPKSKAQYSDSKSIINEMERLFTFALQSVTNVISKSSNELLSQLSEKQSMYKMHSHQHDNVMSLEQIRKKMMNIDNSSKRAVESLINDVKTSVRQLLSEQQQPVSLRS